MEPHIWLIGGTCESARLARMLSERALPYVVTVTTPAARSLYPPKAKVQVGKLTQEQLTQFLSAYNIQGILDASHPFACEISQLAIAQAQSSRLSNSLPAHRAAHGPAHGCLSPAPYQRSPGKPQGTIPYLRYERPPSPSGADNRLSPPPHDRIIQVSSFEALLASNRLQHQRVLFTIGYRGLSQLQPLRQTSQLFARVLPSKEAIQGALQAGFESGEIIALRPPVSTELEIALWRHWRISAVVAKASGEAGGEASKRLAAQQLGVNLFLIQRPKMSYPNQTLSLLEAVSFCATCLKHCLKP